MSRDRWYPVSINTQTPKPPFTCLVCTELPSSRLAVQLNAPSIQLIYSYFLAGDQLQILDRGLQIWAQPCNMELRKKVKRPQRYEPEPDTHLQETYTPHALRPAFPSPFVDFNPDLPPATFPTFDQPRLADLSGRYHTTNSRTEASPLGPEAPTGQQLPRDEVEELLVPSYTSQGIWQASGGPQKQVLVDKLQLLRRKMDRSEEDWISQEMETSDEEEQVDGGHSRVSRCMGTGCFARRAEAYPKLGCA